MSGGIYRSEILNYYKIIIPKEIAWIALNGSFPNSLKFYFLFKI